ncbi:MAG: hypothetical protein ACT4PL_12680 [Phycisphaerales bacterium]
MPKDAKKDAPKTPRRSRAKGGDLFAQVTLALTVLLVIAVGVLAVWGYRRMETKVAGAMSEAGPIRVVIEWPPLARKSTTNKDKATGPEAANTGPLTWVDVGTQRDLTELATRMISASPFDKSSLSQTAAALEGTGWFKRVDSIRREAGGIVRIRGSWRVPGAVVRVQGIDHLVSTEGERLPVDYTLGRSGLRHIVNPAFPPPEPGARWIGGDVQAALSLLASLRDSPAFGQVAGVDTAGYGKSKQLVIVSDKGNRVVWGSAPSEFNPNEPDSATKLRFLSLLVNSPDFGHRIDANKAVIFLTSKKGIIYDSTAPPTGEATSPVDGGAVEPSAAEDLVGAGGRQAEIVRTRQN